MFSYFMGVPDLSSHLSPVLHRIPGALPNVWLYGTLHLLPLVPLVTIMLSSSPRTLCRQDNLFVKGFVAGVGVPSLPREALPGCRR